VEQQQQLQFGHSASEAMFQMDFLEDANTIFCFPYYDNDK
jgi:hypothetical protein